VDAGNAAAIAASGVDALHFSAKRVVQADGGVRLGSAADGAGAYEVTDRDAAFAVVRALGL
jgi:copper homeostasis protein